ncbi:MAG: hypothetical protein SFW66_04315 [Gammaproteobacteria bacterium]|nr:hypothetical protein [Gammaproteobacteria bacterium]
MLSTQTLIERLQIACSDQRIQQAYRTQTRKRLATAGGAFRVFDANENDFTFVPLVSDYLLHTLIVKLQNYILEMYCLYDDEHEPYLQKSDVEYIKIWLKKIIDLGCNELLDSNGLIKKELIEILAWDDLINEKNSAAILCAYVSNILQDVISALYKSTSDDKMKAVMICITQHYSSCATEALKARGFITGADYLSQEDKSFFACFKELSAEEKLIAGGIAAGIIAGLIGVGALLFKSFTSEKRDPSEFKNHPPLPDRP